MVLKEPGGFEIKHLNAKLNTLTAKNIQTTLSCCLDDFSWLKTQVNYISVLYEINPITYPKHNSNKSVSWKPLKILASKYSIFESFHFSAR